VSFDRIVVMMPPALHGAGFTKLVADAALWPPIAGHPCDKVLIEALKVVARLADDRDQPRQLRIEAAAAVSDVLDSLTAE
jgi:hypothetical protein